MVCSPSGAEHQCRDQGRHAGVDVDHSPSCKVERAAAHEPSAAPDPVRHRGVHQQGPQGDEGDVGTEPHPLHHGTRDQGRGDDSEGGLVGHEEHVGDGAFCFSAHALQPDVGETAEEGAAVTEGQTVCRKRPGDPDNAQRHEAHHHRIERVLVPHQASIEESEGRGHEQYQCGGDQHPRGVGGVYGLHVRSIQRVTSHESRVQAGFTRPANSQLATRDSRPFTRRNTGRTRTDAAAY